MDPSQCCVILVDDCITHQDSTVSALNSLYDEVLVVPTGYDALTTLHSRQKHRKVPTLLLIDVENADRSINAHARPNECLVLIRTITKQLKEGRLHDTVPIVCSCSEDPEFMLECLCNGAADYIVKPLKAQAIKTLFLNVYRHRISLPRIGTVPSSVSIASPPQGQVWALFQDRLKSVFLDETWLQRTIWDYYAPEPSVRRSSTPSLTSDKVRYLRSRICSWDFLPLDVSEKELVHCVCLILDQVLQIPDLAEFRVPADDMYAFVFDICNSYHNNNPYHNFRHAVDVLQSTYYFLCKMGVLGPMDTSLSDGGFAPNHDHPPRHLQDILQPLDILALLMASLGHDVGHPGVTNMFMVQSCTPLAVLYNDRSVLESYHSMAFFHLLGQSCFRKLTDMKRNAQYAHFRKMVVHCILATDMSMHDDYVQRIENQAEQWRNQEIDFEDENSLVQQRLTLCGALIKCADIGNCARPFPLAKKWAEILAEEFARQGDLEKELGLTVLPINDRGKVSLEEFQLTFERKIAMKLYQAVGRLIPVMSFCVDFINENIDIWENNQALDSGVGRSEHSDDDDEDEDQEEEADAAPKQDIKPFRISSPSKSHSSSFSETSVDYTPPQHRHGAAFCQCSIQ
ncbi:hypothetical protein BJV82DRAFT_616373 [Fennellomyces sp. T-0311]|nr:hypothetical protein BJV82DRAFT_616373 [Fennellomyces sp. T-0311]